MQLIIVENAIYNIVDPVKLVKHMVNLDDKNMAKKCLRCKTPMKRAGKIKAGPRGGLRPVYICPKCGYRTIKSKMRW